MSKFSEQNRTGYLYIKAFFGIANLFSKKLYLYSLTILSALFVLVNSHGAIHVYLEKIIYYKEGQL